MGNALTFMMTYTWGRRNQHAQMAFLGAFTFSAPYLPFVMLAFSLLMGNSVQMDVVGIFVGHTYYFLEYVYPTLAKIRGWRVKRIMEPPRILHMLCGPTGRTTICTRTSCSWGLVGGAAEWIYIKY